MTAGVHVSTPDQKIHFTVFRGSNSRDDPLARFAFHLVVLLHWASEYVLMQSDLSRCLNSSPSTDTDNIAD
jgi:hypothetical protein